MFPSLIKSATLPVVLAVASLSVTHAQTSQSRNLYDRWINEDVRWIMTDQERADFQKLHDDHSRAKFIEAFWERRNPAPGSHENIFKTEHYRRLAYANQHFAQGVAGWNTDRGRFYITYGPPDEVFRRVHSPESGTRFVPSEEWRWDYIDGLRRNVILIFEDRCGCGEYKLRSRSDTDPVTVPTT
jgi:GWxTD domain-containing protein